MESPGGRSQLLPMLLCRHAEEGLTRVLNVVSLWAEVDRAEVVGLIMGWITVPDRALQRQKKPAVTLVLCKLRPSFSLSRQRSRVRAPSSPPYSAVCSA